jgi:predicted nucleic acid-binding protein
MGRGMKAFADTSFLYAVYRQQDNSQLADAFVTRSREPIRVSSLVIYEFRQSARFQAFRHSRDRSVGFSKRAASQMVEVLQENVNDGAIILVPVEWPEVHSTAERLSAQYTVLGGHRDLDILHVATALQVEAEQLLTFDANQSILARGVGLEVVP